MVPQLTTALAGSLPALEAKQLGAAPAIKRRLRSPTPDALPNRFYAYGVVA